MKTMSVLGLLCGAAGGSVARLWRLLRPLLRPLLRWLWTSLRLLHAHAAPALRRVLWRDEDRRQERPAGREHPDRSQSEREGQHGAEEEEEAPPSSIPEPSAEEDEGENKDEDEFDRQDYRVDPSDEFYCGYDSTWDTEEPQEGDVNTTWQPPDFSHYKFNRFVNAARDMQNYRHKYPFQTRRQNWAKPTSEDYKPNLMFYNGEMPSIPDGVYIHEFHDKWAGQYDTLEHVHTYIQWLFPLEEPGVNYEASPLTKDEIKEFLQSNTAKENLLKSYSLMLDFYGMELVDVNTGAVRKAPNWLERFSNLNRNTHNNLRITRILKCLGVLGYPHYQAPLVQIFLEETLVHGRLSSVRDSVLNYFVFAVLDKRQRRSLLRFAYLNYDRRQEFVWCPKKIQLKWSLLSDSREATDTLSGLTELKMGPGEWNEDFPFDCGQ